MHLSIRARLTATFTLAIAVVIAGLGSYLYMQLRTDLLRSLDQGLRARAQLIASTLDPSSRQVIPSSNGYLEPDESFSQVLDAGGGVVDSTQNVAGHPMVARAELAGAASAHYLMRTLPGVVDPVRLYAAWTPTVRGTRDLVVVGATLADRHDAVQQFLARFAVGAGGTLVLVAIGGWILVGAALRPVERMRQQTERITLADPGLNLAVSKRRDELSRFADTLNDMLDRIRGSYAKERQFMDYASHELRTPLTALKAELELALARPRPVDELRAAAESALEETDRLIHLSERLLTLTQVGASLTSSPVELHALRTVVNRACRASAARASAAGLTITTEVDDSTVEIDADRIHQALLSLLENAIRHSLPGHQITVQGQQDGPNVQLSVCDTGCGFTENFLPTAFEPFARDTSESGSGLGLSIVRAAARAHGGDVAAANRPASGACVTITLPATQ